MVQMGRVHPRAPLCLRFELWGRCTEEKVPFWRFFHPPNEDRHIAVLSNIGTITAERRSCGTSGFIDVQGAAAAKDVRQNHPNLILTFGPELGMMLLLQKVLGIEVLQDNWRRTARCSGKTLMRGMYTIQKT